VPKNKGRFRSREQEIDPHEELVGATNRVVDAIKPHLAKIAAGVAGLAIVLVAVSLWTWYDQRKEARATSALAEAFDVLRSPLDGDVVSVEDLAAAPDRPRYPTALARSQAALEILDGVDAEHGKTDVGTQARLVRAGVLYDLARWDEAIDAYRGFLDRGPDGQLRHVAQEGLGYALEARALAQTDPGARSAGLAEALAAFERLQPDDGGTHRDVALYHQARIKAIQGDRAAALALFRQVLEAHPTTPLRGEIDARVADLEEQS
jgi:tetratricopeptide (TPR) repeat protein